MPPCSGMINLEKQPKKAGFAVIVGRSNVGKSTLMNALVGSKVAITTPKPQTTRMPVQGILSNEQGQVVFVDTAGVMTKAKDSLTKKLLRTIKESLQEIDVLVYVADPTREIGDEERDVLQMIDAVTVPKIMVINKIDLDKGKIRWIDYYRDLSEKFDQVIEASALKGTHVKSVINSIFEYLPEGEAMYPDMQLTNMENPYWIAELIREKLFLRLRQEVPYSVHVVVEEVEPRENGMIYIRAIVYTNEERYKRMIIGKGGRGIREIGQSTRKELELVMDKKVFIDLEVQVDTHWIERY